MPRWLERWTTVRHREAAERTLLTAIATGLSPAVLADALLAAGSERAFGPKAKQDFLDLEQRCGLQVKGCALTPVQTGAAWRVRIAWANGTVHHFGKFASEKDALAGSSSTGGRWAAGQSFAGVAGPRLSASCNLLSSVAVSDRLILETDMGKRAYSFVIAHDEAGANPR